jgi:hypothetical protein
MSKLCALLGAGLLLAAQTCFAEDQWPDQYSAAIGPDAKKEFAALSETGRAAYKRALIACSLYADNYDDPNYKKQCEREPSLNNRSGIAALLPTGRS